MCSLSLESCSGGLAGEDAAGVDQVPRVTCRESRLKGSKAHPVPRASPGSTPAPGRSPSQCSVWVFGCENCCPCVCTCEQCTLKPAIWGTRCASRITPGCILNHLSTIPACRSSFVGLYGMRLLVGGQRVTAGGLAGRVAGTSPHNTWVGGCGGVGY